MKHPGTVREVFAVFLRLGLTSFGGPVAHLGYFREAFVERRRWLSDRAYADLVALAQFLPGPASSKVGMAIGLQRAGAGGLLAAWAAFTLPSAIVLVAFAYGATELGDVAEQGWLLGLGAAAVAVVAQAVIGMARTLTPDLRRAAIAVAAMLVVVLVPHVLTQVCVIVAAGLIGLVALRGTAPAGSADPFTVRVSRTAAGACLLLFGLLLAGLPVLAGATGWEVARFVDVFYRAGALVFGGGHVVLPLLEAATVQTGLVGHDLFLAGYGLAQAVPGPLFTFAAYLGTVMSGVPSGLVGAAVALVAVFLPGGLLMVGVLPFWEQLRGLTRVRSALAGVNAGVVGILAAALYDPVIAEGLTSWPAVAIAAAAFIALMTRKAPVWAVVAAAAIAGLLFL